ncbi:MAG: TOBE domain-containing protein [Acinetobacter sp.]
MTITAVNVRNQFKGVVQEVVLGTVVSEINVETKAGLFTSIISTRSVQDLDLKIGSEVVVLIKSTEVSLAKL